MLFDVHLDLLIDIAVLAPRIIVPLIVARIVSSVFAFRIYTRTVLLGLDAGHLRVPLFDQLLFGCC